jgi:hypothetical protein
MPSLLESARFFAKRFVRSFPAHKVAQWAFPEQAKLQASVKVEAIQAFKAMGWTPDPWQREFLTSYHLRQALLCCRRAGKSATSAAKTWEHCLSNPNSLALVFSPTMRQSLEYGRMVRQMDRAMGFPVKVISKNLTGIEWANGSRLLSLPDSQAGVVGFTPTRIVIDEGSRVSDMLYMSIRPMLALGASLEVLSTPFGKMGWFFEIFNTPKRRAMFKTYEITAAHCPRITPAFLEEELNELGEKWFQQEYFLAFNDAIDAVFAESVITAAFRETDDGPLFGSVA